MTQNIVTRTDTELATASLNLTFSTETPHELIREKLHAPTTKDNISFETTFTTLKSIILLDHSSTHSNGEFLVSNVKQYQYNKNNECTAVLFKDNTMKLFSHTVPVKEKHAQHTIDELKNTDTHISSSQEIK